MQNAAYWISKLHLKPHPEGGWFREVYRSEELINTSSGMRNVSTSIYYLLEGKDFSAFHRIRSDEIWHYYAGTSEIEILWMEENKLRISLLGRGKGDSLMTVIPKNCWFAAEGFALAGCTIALGFHFDDLEIADESLSKDFPQWSETLKDLIRV